MDLDNIVDLLKQQGTAIETFRKNIESAVSTERKEREALEARMNRTGAASPVESGNGLALSTLSAPLREAIKAGDMKPLLDHYEAKAMSVSSDPDGGFTVYPELSAKITEKVYETSPFRQLARVQKIGTDTLEELVDLDEVEAGWVAEMGSRDDTDTPGVGKNKIPVHEIYAQPKVTQKLLDDSRIDIATWLVNKIGKKFARSETAAFFTGDGVGKPRGFLDHTKATDSGAGVAWGSIGYVATGVDGDFAASPKGDKLTGKPYVKFYATRRVGGDVTNFEAIKLLKFYTS